MDAEQIVRALAAHDSPTDSEYGTCAFCEARDVRNIRAGAVLPGEPTSHAPDCPWWMAQEWVAAQEETRTPSK